MAEGFIDDFKGKDLCYWGVSMSSGRPSRPWQKRSLPSSDEHVAAFGNQVRVHKSLSAIELCDSLTSWGSSFFSIEEGVFCDMSTKTKVPLCKAGETEGCFVYEKPIVNGRGGYSTKRNVGIRGSTMKYNATYFVTSDGDVYEELLKSNEGDILVKLKDARYCNKQYTGSYVPLLFEILCITDYYDVATYRRYISDRAIKLITNVPICLTIAFEALKHGILTSKIYARCLGFLKKAVELQKRVCLEKPSEYSSNWRDRARNKGSYGVALFDRNADEQVESIESSKPLMDISELPGFIVDDVVSPKIDNNEHVAPKPL
ncbi:hypothetical protein BGZ47_003610, partial [Haplosporangium gracile]